MADNSNADELSIEQLISELRIVRLSTRVMFDSFNRQILETNCKFYKYEMSVLAMGFNIIGHQLHHFNIIQEKYFPGFNSKLSVTPGNITQKISFFVQVRGRKNPGGIPAGDHRRWC